MKLYDIFLSVVVSGALTVPQLAPAQTKISQRDRMKLEILEENVVSGNRRHAAAAQPVTMLVKVATGTTEDDITALGATVSSVIGDIFVVEVPLSRVDALLASEKVISAQMDSPDKPDMYYARMEKNGNINVAHSDMRGDLGHNYLGKGVVCGVFDIGFDVNHVDFLDNADRTKMHLTFEKGPG